MRASMLDGLERGKPMELEHLSGAVVRLGQQAGVHTPTHAFVLAALSPSAKDPSD
ncbi:MAG: ketopantoate reductase C-terminal domain-containing protein [Pseudomonadota bacterium]